MTRRKILLADDDEAVLDFMQAKLGAKYDLVTTNAADNVGALARQHRPDLIICDVDMPEMDGGDVSAALYDDEDTRTIPMLFLTGLVSASDLKATRGDIGGRPAIAKNAPVAELVARIEALVRK
ncbi:MAG: response regulator [Betaproteobacteria bacterium]|nr:response regulator [Betaproteobacteria bacterium]